MEGYSVDVVLCFIGFGPPDAADYFYRPISPSTAVLHLAAWWTAASALLPIDPGSICGSIQRNEGSLRPHSVVCSEPYAPKAARSSDIQGPLDREAYDSYTVRILANFKGIHGHRENRRRPA